MLRPRDQWLNDGFLAADIRMCSLMKFGKLSLIHFERQPYVYFWPICATKDSSGWFWLEVILPLQTPEQGLLCPSMESPRNQTLNTMMRWDPEFFFCICLFWDFQSLGHRNPTWLNISWSDLVVTMAFSSHFHTMWSWRHVLRSWYWQVHLCGRSNFKSQYLGWRDKPPGKGAPWNLDMISKKLRIPSFKRYYVFSSSCM